MVNLFRYTEYLIVNRIRLPLTLPRLAKAEVGHTQLKTDGGRNN